MIANDHHLSIDETLVFGLDNLSVGVVWIISFNWSRDTGGLLTHIGIQASEIQLTSTDETSLSFMNGLEFSSMNGEEVLPGEVQLEPESKSIVVMAFNESRRARSFQEAIAVKTGTANKVSGGTIESFSAVADV